MSRFVILRNAFAASAAAMFLVCGCCEQPCPREKIYVDRYEHVKCTNCPGPKYVYCRAPDLPEKVICVHRIKEPCPPQQVVRVNLPPRPQKVRYKYVDEGGCKPPCPPKPCVKECRVD